MRSTHYKYIALILLAILSFNFAKAQYSVNMTRDTIIINTADYPVGNIYDDGGPFSNYSNVFDGIVILVSSPGVPIILSGSFDTESNFDKINIYDGWGTDPEHIMSNLSGSGNIDSITSYSGYMTISFHTDRSVTSSGFELSYTSCINASCTNKPFNLTFGNIGPNSAQISWSANTPGTFIVETNDTAYLVSDTSLELNSLQSSTLFNVAVYDINDSANRSCCYTTGRFSTECEFQVNFPYDNLYDSNVTCYYGSYQNPYQNVGVIDFSSNSMLSRHTIHSDRNETDSRTENLLRCVPDGYCTSVRLGNWMTGAEAESIEYNITVDTNERDLLLLKYAAVMEHPYHSTSEQPKFEFGIFDSAGNSINECYNATFISSNELGWNINSFGNIVWKDWTTVGVDLVPLQGQTITIRLTTYDCSLTAHFGYAYFVLDLSNKNMTSESCTTIENTYHAPSGFNYEWYRIGQEDDVISTSDSLHVTTEGFYQCRLSFIGAPNDEAHANCSFTMNVYAGLRYPVADFRPEVIDTVSSCADRTIKMVNTSFVATDTTHTTRIQNRCESYLWNFGDGSTSTDINPTHTFTPGLHRVTLYAMLARGECTDSLTLEVNAGRYCAIYDTVYATICDNDTIEFLGSTFNTAGVYSIQDTAETTMIISVHSLSLNVNPTNSVTIFDTVVENNLPHYFHSMTFSTDADSSMFFAADRPACDTIIEYHLKVWHNISDTILHYICNSDVPFHDGGFTFYNDSIASSSYGGIHGEDSLVTYIIHIIPSTDTTIYDTIIDYQLPWVVWDTVFNDSVAGYEYITVNEAGCDSTIHYNLHVFWNGDHCDTNLTYPNVVTANGDGKNDRFVIGGLIENNCFKYNELIIYDRTGRKVYHMHNIHEESQWWDPNEKRSPAGTYYFIFKAHGVNIHTMHKGVIEVLREK